MPLGLHSRKAIGPGDARHVRPAEDPRLGRHSSNSCERTLVNQAARHAYPVHWDSRRVATRAPMGKVRAMPAAAGLLQYAILVG